MPAPHTCVPGPALLTLALAIFYPVPADFLDAPFPTDSCQQVGQWGGFTKGTIALLKTHQMLDLRQGNLLGPPAGPYPHS